MQEQEKRQTLFYILYYAAIGGTLFFFFKYVCIWMLPFFLGTGIAALMRPLTLSFAKRAHIGEKTACVLILLFFYLTVAGAAGLFLTIVLAQLYELLLRLPDLYAQNIAPVLDQLSGWFYGLAGRFYPDTGQSLESLSDAIAAATQQAAVDGSAHLVSWAAGIAAKLPLLLIAAVFTVVISILTASNYRMVARFLRNLIPKRLAPRVCGLQRFARETIWQFVRAYIIIMAVTFCELGFGLWLLGFEYVLPVAAAITLLDILPLIGSGTILVPWGLVLIAGGDPPGGIGLLLLFAVIEVIRNIIEPRIVGDQIGLHPIATITSMYAGLQIAGFVGLFAAPVLVLFARYLYENGTEEAL